MKNKLLLLITIIVIIAGSIVFFLLARKDANFQLEGDYVITYSFNGGFGPYIYTTTKTIELDNNGNVLIYAYIYDEKEVKRYHVSTDGIDELADEMIHGKFSRLKSELVEDDCYDAGSSTLSIKGKGFEKKVYNYCKYNETFYDIEHKFMNIVGRDNLNDFEDYLRDKYEENDY